MELNITEFFRAVDPYTYSHSMAEGGPHAGLHTWNAAKQADFQMLDTDDKRDAFREFLKSSGYGCGEEIATLPDNELNALCIQWIAGDMREPVGFELGPDTTDAQWEEYEQNCSDGNCAGRILRGNDGQVYFYIGS